MELEIIQNLRKELATLLLSNNFQKNWKFQHLSREILEVHLNSEGWYEDDTELVKNKENVCCLYEGNIYYSYNEAYARKTYIDSKRKKNGYKRESGIHC